MSWYNSYMEVKKEVWEDQLDDMLDKVILYVGDWEELLDMLAAADNKADRPLLFKYMEYLITRVQLMDRKFNRVRLRFLRDRDKVWQIENYDFKMYKYVSHKYPDNFVVTKWSIFILDEILSETDRDKLQAQS